MNFENIFKEYINYLKITTKKSTYEEKILKIKKYIIPFFKDKNIFNLKSKDIIEWKYFIESFNFSYHHKSNIYYCLTTFLDFMIKYYDLDKNVARIEGNFRNNDFEDKGSIWSYDDFKKFMNVITKEEHILLFKLLFYTGVRKGELMALTYKDIDYNLNTIRINKTITKYHEITTPKTKSSNRIIYVNDDIIESIKKVKQKNNSNEEELIFKMSFTQLKRIKDYYCKQANVKQIKIHEFRHSNACLLFKNNIEIETISKRLGHSNLSMTMNTYLKYLPNNEKRVINLLNSLT